MKVLVALPSCYALRHLQQVVRDTWLKDLSGADYKFFLGRREGIHDCSVRVSEDEVFVDALDDLQSLTIKMQAVYTWTLYEGYDFVFKCDLDTLVRPSLLLTSGFENHDYSGGQNGFFASGGAGYWTSRKARELSVSDARDQRSAEDVHTAQAVIDNGLKFHADPRYKFIPGAILTTDTISYHLSSVKGWSGKYDQQMMRDAYTLSGEYSQESNTRPIRFRRKPR